MTGEHEADHSTHSTAKVKNEWSYLSTEQYPSWLSLFQITCWVQTLNVIRLHERSYKNVKNTLLRISSCAEVLKFSQSAVVSYTFSSQQAWMKIPFWPAMYVRVHMVTSTICPWMLVKMYDNIQTCLHNFLPFIVFYWNILFSDLSFGLFFLRFMYSLVFYVDFLSFFLYISEKFWFCCSRWWFYSWDKVCQTSHLKFHGQSENEQVSWEYEVCM